jgi:hypothetical protein
VVRWKSADVSEEHVAFSFTVEERNNKETKTPADFQRTTRLYNPENKSLHNYRCANLKSYT